MKKTFAAFVAVATIAGSLAATPASAQRGVAAGVAAPGSIMGPAITDPVAGNTTILVVANGCNSVSGTAMAFSIVLSRQPSPALLFFKLIEVETKFPFANSISAFSRSQDPERTLTPAALHCPEPN
jgi:hypothetical protein